MAWLTPIQIARLACQWYDANKADPIATIRHTAEQYRYEPEQIEQAIDELRKLRPSLVPSSAPADDKQKREPEPFTLANPEPKPVFWKAPKQPKPRQTVLFAGMNLIAGQNDLFETDGRAE